MACRLVVALCLAVFTLGVAIPQESDDGGVYNDPGSPVWTGSVEEDRLLRFEELQGQWSGSQYAQPERQTSPIFEGPGTVSLSLLNAPKAAKKAYQHGLDELKRKRPNLDRVRKELGEAVAEYPEMAPAWELLGWIDLSEGKRAEGRAMFLKSVEADSRHQNGYIALAHAAVEVGEWQQALEWSTKAVRLDGSVARAHFYCALSSFQLNDLDTAASEATSVIESTYPFFPAYAHQIRGAVHERRNDLQAAVEDYRVFLKAEPRHPLSEGIAKLVAAWEKAGLVTAPKPHKRRS